MFASYPARYKDRFGEEATTIFNDGRSLRMVVRGVAFEAKEFDGFTPEEPECEIGHPAPQLPLHHGELCSCTIEWEMPVTVSVEAALVMGNLKAQLILGDPREDERRGLDHEELKLTLVSRGRTFKTKGSHGDFEAALVEMKTLLPEGMRMHICFFCAFSDYSPYGSGFFGSLFCFRGNKEAYSHVKGKSDLFAIWDSVTEEVQETYLCPDFAPRVPGTGYRG